MVGEWRVTKPSRSDEVLDANQQLEIANQIRAQFDSITPKRPPKPNRSESDATSSPTPAPSHSHPDSLPELLKLRSLQSQSQSQSQSSVIVSAEMTNSSEQDEFVETQYYKELDSVDKQHHTTGSGFIKVAREETANGYEIQLPRSHGVAAVFSGCRSNPATNDWTSDPEYDQGFVSCKPNRSESS